ncbi:MAG: 16S rRNA (cytidine(1402)-2'-O)-methyltransferase [Chloroflexi bacterium]|nr:16S rRNA (cytidine(1402)-2'-O)-methyltransferase [Chloroflexota bacterium]
MSTLYLVATPIGNLEDISARALRILKEVDLIAAEDTRHTGKLLAHFDIQTPQTSYFEHNKAKKLRRVLDNLENGDVALVSDAGTPALNDPGFLLVRAALKAGHDVSPIPGPSAPLAALVSSGLPTDRYLYMGYLPRKSADRRRTITEVAEFSYTLIWLESPHRLEAALIDIHAVLGDRQIAIASELTKMYEHIWRGSLREGLEYIRDHPARGEYTLVVAGKTDKVTVWPEGDVREALQQHLDSGARPADLARQMAHESGWPRRKVYELITEIQEHKQKS